MNVKVVKELDDRQILVNADKNQLCQVLINLIINAFDAMEGHGTLTLKTYRDWENGKVYTEVTDSGGGIPQENLSKVFDPFFTTKELGKGTGLGLSMAYGIMEENHGRISIKKTGPQGTTTLLELTEEKVANEFHFMSIGWGGLSLEEADNHPWLSWRQPALTDNRRKTARLAGKKPVYSLPSVSTEPVGR